jgi:hypothetical protein
MDGRRGGYHTCSRSRLNRRVDPSHAVISTSARVPRGPASAAGGVRSTAPGRTPCSAASESGATRVTTSAPPTESARKPGSSKRPGDGGGTMRRCETRSESSICEAIRANSASERAAAARGANAAERRGIRAASAGSKMRRCTVVVSAAKTLSYGTCAWSAGPGASVEMRSSVARPARDRLMVVTGKARVVEIQGRT